MKKHIALLVGLFLCLIATTALAISPMGAPVFQFHSEGEPVAGGKLYSYQPGSGVSKITYSDYQGTTGNANPTILDSNGAATIYLDGAYKLILHDSNDNLIWTEDNFYGEGVSFVSGTSGQICLWGPSGTSEIRGVDSLTGVSIIKGSLPTDRLDGPVTTGVSSVGKTIIGGVSVIHTHSAVTIESGTCTWLYGAILSNYGAISAVTYTIEAGAYMGMNFNICLGHGIDSDTGSSIWVVMGNSGNTIENRADFATGKGSGTSYYFLSGTSDSDNSLTFIGTGLSRFRVWETGSPSQNTVE